ncbi:SAM-dependent chlorinase/fluorinase [Nitrospiraceae bacterium AH_259_D15_M11_P09]|nr:SAM-dependent chlorinase/fluorinase [Nitrospiraceae bacterium AH_259_D15_M11_P09]
MPSAISVVTLLTDFGNRDYFTASMKGVILGINPQARIVDLSHEVAPQQVEEGAYLLGSSYRYFPDGTVHVAVVDPGVGSTRRPLLVTSSRYFFLAPDNGLLSYVLHEELSVEVRLIENKQYRLDSEGATFDGRDLFAPAAAWLTRGQTPGSYGRLIHDYVRLPIVEPSWEGAALVGRIAYVDHFGNLISNVTSFHLKELRGKTKRDQVTIRLAGLTIDGLVSCYADGRKDTPHALLNSNGRLEVFIREGRAAEWLKIGRGERIEVI